MALHSSTLAWKIPWAEEPGRLLSMGSQRVGHDWATSLYFSLWCIGEGSGNPLQCSYLENPRDGGAWWASVYGVAQSRTWLKWLSSNRHVHRRRQWHPTAVLLPGKSHGWRSLVGCSPWGREESDTTERLHFIFHFRALEKEMATHSSVLAWRIQGAGEPGGLPSMGSHRVEHDWSNLAAAADMSIVKVFLCVLPSDNLRGRRLEYPYVLTAPL